MDTVVSPLLLEQSWSTSGEERTIVNRGKRKWHKLDLLTRAGAGLVPIAPAICRALRDIIGADAASLFWLDDNSMPIGVFHESPSNSAMDLFVNEYDRLFTGPGEINVTQIATGRGNPAGRLLRPPADYFKSNTLNLLVRSSHHYHTLDLRVDVAGRARAVVMLFREQERPFNDRDARDLSEAIPFLRRAIECREMDDAWEKPDTRGHFLVDQSGSELIMFDDDASSLLKECTLVGQGISIDSPSSLPPKFVRDLCLQLEHGSQAQQSFDVAPGRLNVTAKRFHSPGADRDGHVLISLEMQRSRPLKIVETLLDLPLSPLQRSIALDAALGGSRASSLNSSGVGREALKKHLAVIYRTVGVNSWEQLAKALT